MQELSRARAASAAIAAAAPTYCGGHVQVHPKQYLVYWGWGQSGNNPRRAPVLHAGRTVMVTRYRLPIGLVPSTVAIEGDAARVDASVLFRLPTLRTALREAGFEVVDRKVWFGLPGRGRGPASPLPVLLAFIALTGTLVAAGSQLGWW